MKAEARQIVRELNDAFRQSFEGGQVALSAGVAALPASTVAELVAAVRAFDHFDADDDPYGEHDFGSLEITGERVFWKIDYFDATLRWHSPDASGPGVTARVLTIMLASEF